MKLKYLSLILLFFSIIINYGCDDNIQNSFDNSIKDISMKDLVLGTSSVDDTQGTMWIEAIGTVDQTGYQSYQSNAIISSSSSRNDKVDVGTVKINNVSLTKYDNNEYHTFDSQSTAYGDTTSFLFSGNTSAGIDSFYTEMYIPDIIEATLPNGLSHDKSTNLTISWNPDNDNPNDVYIMLHYSKEFNQLLDSTMTDSSVIKTYTTEDDGSYTINSSDFNEMPENGEVQLFIGRGNNKIVAFTEDEYHLVYAATLDITIIKLTD